MAPQNTQHLETHQLVRRTMALVLAGGRGSRLKQLTDRRAKPAVYFGGKYRIIDFTLSNCLNSGIRRIGVATQYKSHSLMRHIQSGWSFLRAELGEMVEMLPAQQRIDEAHWYRGTADAVYQNLDIIRDEKPDYVIVLAGDHIYKQDYSLMIKDHVDHGVDCTVGCIEVPRMEAVAFGVMHIDEKRNVTAFLEKPADPPAMPGKPDIALASMGIYVFNADYLYRVLEEDLNNPGVEPRLRPRCDSARGGGRHRACAPVRHVLREPGAGRAGRTGVTSAPSMHSGKPTSISRCRTRSSTCTTPTGRSGPTSARCRPRSSCRTATAITASRSTR